MKINVSHIGDALMGLDSFKTEDTSKDSPTNSKNQHGETGKYSDNEVIEILNRCNDSTSGNNISRDRYDSWRSSQDDEMPSASWFYRNGGWNGWLKKAGIQLNSRGTRITFDTDVSDMSNSKAYVIGVLIGDGSVIVKKGQHRIQLNTIDEEFRDKFVTHICNFTGLEESEITTGTTDSEKIKGENAKMQYTAAKSSKELALELNEYMKPRWPNWFNDLEHSNINMLMEGLYDSEGSYDTDKNKCRFTNTDISVKNLFINCISHYIEGRIEVNEIKSKSIDYGDFSVQEYYREKRDNLEYQIIMSEHLTEKVLKSIDPVVNRKKE